MLVHFFVHFFHRGVYPLFAIVDSPMNTKLICASLFLFSPLLAEEILPPPAQEFEVNLKNPTFSNGVITTEEGGTVSAPNMKIQARKITYTNRIENGIAVQKIEAEGDLLMEYGERAFVGKKLEYNFITKTGSIWEAKTYVDVWFLGGERIDLAEDGTFLFYNAYITTCESQGGGWDIHAHSMTITKQHLLSAKNIQLRLGKLPIFWFPRVKANLNFMKDSPIRYKLKWDKGLGPRLSMRYRFFSWEEFKAYIRFDYRLTKGPGLALETDYRPLTQRTIFRTRSYGAYDKSWPDEKTNKRYRFQGLYQYSSPSGKSFVHAIYDKLSDDKMPGDFKSDDFEVNTQQRTRFFASHHEKQFLSSFSLQPKINRFQTINQELPYVTTNIHPFRLGKTGIIWDNFFNAGYLDYNFTGSLSDFVSSTQSARLETRNQVYRPFRLSKFTLTPNVGFVGIYYTDNPARRSVGQALFNYGGTASTYLFKSIGRYEHMLEPYATFTGLSRPSAGINDHFYFSIDDGLAKLKLLRVGLRNRFYNSRTACFLAPLTADIYTYGFFGDRTYNLTFPKTYLDLTWSQPSYALYGGVAWNQEENVLDYSNVRGLFTINADLAFTTEFRHRSKYDWRKVDHQNFILDATQTIPNLLRSPLSDRRNTLLFKLFGRIMPGFTFAVQSHHGWGRKKEPAYSEFKIEFFKMITCSWQLKFAYQYQINDPFQVTASINLVKPKP
jgi:hypothetical protein